MTRTPRLKMVLMASVLALPTLAVAQTPFDMSPERGGSAPTVRDQRPDGAFVMPFDTEPNAAPKLDFLPAAPVPFTLPEEGPRLIAPEEPVAPVAPVPAEPPPERTASASDIDRFILPAANLRFEGESGRRSWGIALTAAQAARATTLAVTHNSSIYVAPENSSMRISINDRLVLDQPLSAESDDKRATIALLPGTLKAGINVVTLEVVQRHRTDCTIESTYELWTDIESAGTGFVFDGGAGNGFVTVDDLRAVGTSPNGTTTLRVVLPGGDRMLAEADLLRLVQAVALLGNYRQQKVEIASTLLPETPPGTLQIAVGTTSELSALPGVPAEAATSAVVDFADGDAPSPMLVVSGPNRTAVIAAIAQLAVGVERPPTAAPTVVNTTPWLLPTVPILTGEQSITFADLAIPTEEFTGRRSHAEFHVALPGDFYAEAYGTATVYLDAAYTEKVRPGSHLDIYVNGFIAANTPLTSASGDIFRHLPISVALTHFRPGVNRVTIEAVLDTEADDICAPGASNDEPARFALFDSSEFSMPDFARIDRWPNLAALAGAGAPYGRSETPVQIVLGRVDANVYAAAATFLTRLAISSDGVIPTTIGRTQALVDAPAIFIGALDQFAAPTLAEIGISETARNSWTGQSSGELSSTPFEIDPLSSPPATFGVTTGTKGVYDRWQNELVNPSGLRGTWFAFENWLEETFELSFSSLNVGSREEPDYSPPGRATAIIAQSPAASDRLWTMVAGPTEEALVEGVTELSIRQYWSILNGRASSFDDATGVTDVPALSQRFIFGDGFSLQNMRLVAANWLSINIVGYAFALVLLCTILGICTAALLARLGRRS